MDLPRRGEAGKWAALSAVGKYLKDWSEQKRHGLACAVIVLAGLAVYWNSLNGPMVFDDEFAITENPTIRSLWPPGPVIFPQEGSTTVAGRPILNLSFALNYAAGGLQVWGYHAANLGIHLAAALALYGFLWRTLRQPGLEGRFGEDGWQPALAIALLWVVHPLQTESVTYLSQRAESLASLFYLLTLYCFVRGVEGEGSKGWRAAAVAACALGMGTKEIMASAPLLVWLYDRTFVAGTFREALRRRGEMYGALAGTWLVLGFCGLAARARGGSASLSADITTLGYAQTQCYALLKYLGLAVWPHPLVFDYGIPVISDPRSFLPGALVLLVLGAATLVAIRRQSPLGFAGAWFFAVLAPSSSVVRVTTQTMAEHRMYLPLAAVLSVVILTAYAWMGRGVLLASLAAAIALGGVTISRNRDYQSEFAIWNDTARKCPTNARALGNMATLCLKARNYQAAVPLAREAIRLHADYAEPHSVLGIVYCTFGHNQEGLREFREAVRINPKNANIQINLGQALRLAGEEAEGRAHLEEALRLSPGNPVAKQLLQGTTP